MVFFLDKESTTKKHGFKVKRENVKRRECGGYTKIVAIESWCKRQLLK